jgi:hypothetical protein
MEFSTIHSRGTRADTRIASSYPLPSSHTLSADDQDDGESTANELEETCFDVPIDDIRRLLSTIRLAPDFDINPEILRQADSVQQKLTY